MYIRRKVFSVIKDEVTGEEKLFSTTDYTLEQKEFGKVRSANRILKKSWESREARKLGDQVFRNTGIDLGSGDEKKLYRLKNIIDSHGGIGVMKHPTNPSKDIKIGSDAVLNKRRNLDHKINTKSLQKGPTNDPNHGIIKDPALVSDAIPNGKGINQSRYETMRTGGRQKGKGGVWNEH